MKYTFFWGHDKNKTPDPEYSQWYLQDMTYFGMTFNCCEQWMMFHKAMLFGDYHSADLIMKAKTPDVHKALGRKVANFNEEKWKQSIESILMRGNYLKFTQNEDSYQKLMDSKDSILVEASIYDKIYGIGMASNNLNATNPEKWNGLNKLGFALTDLRIKCMEKHNEYESDEFLEEYQNIKNAILSGQTIKKDIQRPKPRMRTPKFL